MIENISVDIYQININMLVSITMSNTERCHQYLLYLLLQVSIY